MKSYSIIVIFKILYLSCMEAIVKLAITFVGSGLELILIFTIISDIALV